MKISLEEAILAAGYEPLIIVGFGSQNGQFSLKVGANPAIRTVREETWELIRATVIKSLDRLRDLPMDDLEIVS